MSKADEPVEALIQTPNLGGIADSPYMGVNNSLATIVGFDLHSIPGVMVVNQKMTKESGAPTDDFYKIVPASDGNIYAFGKTTGNVYKKSSGTWSFVGTVSPSSGTAGILDAFEYNGFLYYCMSNRIGQWTLGGSFSGRNDNWNTFTNGNSNYHPAYFLPNAQFVFIGDGNLLAQIDNNNTWTPNALATIATHLFVTSLGSQGSDLLIGASILNGVGKSFVLRWNTWSPVPTTAYPVNEPGINAFFPSEDEVVINAGVSGNLYHLNGAVFEITKQIPPTFPNIYSPSAQITINYPAVANKQGIPLFGVSNGLGNPTSQAIYSWGRRDENYPKILALEFPISTNNFNNITIWSIAVQGNDVYVSSYDANSTTYQIDKLDYTTKYNGAYFETLITRNTRIWLDKFTKFVTNIAESMPSGCSITMAYKINGGSWNSWNSGNLPADDDYYYDDDRHSQVADSRIDARTLQVRVTVNTSGNNAPMIEDLIMIIGGQ